MAYDLLLLNENEKLIGIGKSFCNDHNKLQTMQ